MLGLILGLGTGVTTLLICERIDAMGAPPNVTLTFGCIGLTAAAFAFMFPSIYLVMLAALLLASLRTG